MSITKKLIKGSIWNSISQFGNQGINFVITLVLARLLGPENYGLIGMVTIIVTFFGYFSEFGFIGTLVQKKDVDDLDYYTAFWGTIFFGIIIYLIVFFGAPLISLYYNEGRLTLITRIFFINFLIMPLNFIPETREIKLLKYDKLSIAELGSSFLAGVAAIIIAVRGGGVWSLVFFQIVRVTVRALMLFAMTKWLPKFRFSLERFLSFLKTGLQFTINSLMKYLTENVDYLIVAKMLGAKPLGIYTLAFRLSKYPISKAWLVFGKMLFPAFSTMQDEEKIRQNLLKLSFTAGIILIPILVFAIFSIKSIIVLFLGSKWIPVIPIARFFFFYLIIYSICIADDSVIMSLGKVHILNIIKMISTVCLFFAGFFATMSFKLMGMTWAFTFVTIFTLLIIKLILHKMLMIKFLKTWKIFFHIIMLAIIYFIAMFSVSYLYKKFFLNSDIIQLIINAGLTGIIALLSIKFYLQVDLKNKSVNIKLIKSLKGHDINEKKQTNSIQ